MRGGSIKGLQELLGHSNIIMTQRYSHISEQSKKNMVCLLDEPDVEISKHKIGTVEENRHLQISASA